MDSLDASIGQLGQASFGLRHSANVAQALCVCYRPAVEQADDALRLIEKLNAEVHAHEGCLKGSLDLLKVHVKIAHRQLGVSQAELARRTGRHRNTIATWCAESKDDES